MSNSLINLVKIYIDELNWSIIPIKKRYIQKRLVTVWEN
jgi:hypothetical protein